MKRRRPGPLVGFDTLSFSHVIVSFFLYFFVFWYSLFFLFLFLISFFSFSCLSFSFLIAFLFCLFWLLVSIKITDFAKKISFILLKIFFIEAIIKIQTSNYISNYPLREKVCTVKMREVILLP